MQTILERKKRWVLWLALLMPCGWAKAQQVVDPSGCLAAVAAKLREGKERVSIVHIGDSHVQAGYFSQPLRAGLNRKYGRAGYGWISGHRLYGSNQPDPISLHADPRYWQCERLTQKMPSTAMVGPGGISLMPRRSSSSVTLGGADGNSMNYVLVYRDESSVPMSVADGSGSLIGSARYDGVVVDSFKLTSPSSSVRLKAEGPKQIFFGFEVYKNPVGPLLHEIGLNGARFDQYASDGYVQRLAMLHPDMVIVSLGTNDSYSRKWTEASSAYSIRQLILLIQHYCPEAAIVLTTPPPCYLRTTTVVKRKRRRRAVRRVVSEPNPNTARMAALIMKVAKENNCAAIDLYQAMGGSAKLSMLRASRQISGDGVHYSPDGYRRQGDLLWRALDLAWEKVPAPTEKAAKLPSDFIGINQKK